MAVKPVEYVKDSSTQGFAVAGDEKVITKQNANTIQKDVDQGNTEDLDNAQERCLERYVDFDNIEYTEEENRNVGRNQIDTEGADKNSDGGVAGSTVATGIAVAAGTTFAVTTQTCCCKLTTLGMIMDGFNQAILGGVMTGLAAISLGLTFTFDKTLNDKENQTAQAEANNQLIQQYYDELTNNMDSMTADSEAYAAAAEKKFGESVALIDVIGEIDAQIIVYRAQGNEEKVAELMKQKEQYKKDAEVLNTDDPDGMGALKENIELYASRNAEAQGVSESGSLVSDFLKQGHAYKTWAIINAVALGACGLLCASTVLTPKLAPFFIDTISTTLGKVLFIAAGLTFAYAATRMSIIAGKEGDAADAGDQMGEYIAQLNENIGAQAGFTEEIAAGYTAIDEAGAEVVTKTQEGVDKALQNQQQRLQNQPPENKPTGTPDNNPNPNSEPEQEEEPAA